MLFLTRWFGVTGSDAERNLDQEHAYAEEIVEKVLLMQANAATRQHCPLHRATHAKGVTARAQFEVFDVTIGRDAALAARLAHGIFKKPGIYPALVRFANSDPNVNSDFKADVRAMSFSVDLTENGTIASFAGVGRQDFSMQSASTLPINDARAFLATMKVLTAAGPLKRLWSLPLGDKLRVIRAITLAKLQLRRGLEPYQRLRYWSTVPFSHGPMDVVKQCATPSPGNLSHPLQRKNSDAMHDELVRHVNQDRTMSSFDFGLQFLDAGKMTYWGERQNANFWIENASVEWNEADAPFHTVARLTLIPNSILSKNAGETNYIDVTGNSAPDSAPVGSINRARWRAEAASKKARIGAGKDSEAESFERCLR